MKRYLIIITILWSVFSVKSQEISLGECQQLARENFPLTRQQGLIDQVTKNTIAALLGQKFPQ